MNILGVCLVFLLVISASAEEIRIKVVDSEGDPVKGAKVGSSFGVRSSGLVLYSDNLGFVTRSRSKGTLRLNVECKGFYRSKGSLFSDSVKNSNPDKNSFLVKLKEVRNPVEMVRHEFKSKRKALSADAQLAGFDLIKGDFVHPHGEGENVDFVISLKGKEPLFLSVGSLDGFFTYKNISQDWSVNSFFSAPYEAPTEGYVKSLAIASSRNEMGMHKLGGRNFGFKARAYENSHGAILAAYGWFVGPIGYRVTSDGGLFLDFVYYVQKEIGANRSLEPNGYGFELRAVDRYFGL